MPKVSRPRPARASMRRWRNGDEPARPHRLRRHTADRGLAGRRADRGPVRHQLRGGRREQRPQRRRGSEAFLSDMVGAPSHPARAMAMESLYEYGSRAGFWRLHRLFTDRQVPVTVVRRRPGDGEESRRGRGDAGGRLGDRQPRLALDRLSGRSRRRPSASTSRGRSSSTPGSPASARSAGIRAAPRPTPRGWSPRKAASSTTPTATPTTCPITTDVTDAPS